MGLGSGTSVVCKQLNDRLGQRSLAKEPSLFARKTSLFHVVGNIALLRVLGDPCGTS